MAEMILEAWLTGPNWFLIKSNLRAAHFPGLPISFSDRKSCWAGIRAARTDDSTMGQGRSTHPLEGPLEHVTCFVLEEILLQLSLGFLVPKASAKFGETQETLEFIFVTFDTLKRTGHTHEVKDAFVWGHYRYYTPRRG